LQIFKVVQEARNRGRAKFKLKQKEAQTKECSKQVTVNGDIVHQLASERDMLNAALETFQKNKLHTCQPWNIQKMNPTKYSFRN